MNFLSPAILLGLLAAAIPPLIHLIHRRRAKLVRFPALEFILRSNKKTSRRFRVKQFLLMLVRSLLLGLLAFALAQPYVSHVRDSAAAVSGSTGTTVLVMDATYPMQYALDGESLLDRARLRAGQILDDLGSHGQAALTVAGAKVLVPLGEPTHDLQAVRRALDALEPSDQFGTLPDAVAHAYELVKNQPAVGGRRVVVLTTAAGAASALPQPPPATNEAERIELIPVDVADSRAVPNRAVLDVHLRPAPELGGGQWRVEARVGNFSDDPIERLPVRLDINGKTRVRGFVTLGSGEVKRKTFHARLDTQDATRAAVAVADDGLAIDNSRPFWLQPAPKIRVLAVNGDARPTPYRDELFYLERALAPGTEAGTRIRLTIAEPDTLERYAFENFDVVMFANFASPKPAEARALEAFVRSGGGLLLTMGDRVEPREANVRLSGLLPRMLRHERAAGDAAASAEGRDRRSARLADFDRTHPILRPFMDPASSSLGRARVSRYMLLDPSPDAKGEMVIGLEDGAPYLLTRTVDNGRVALLTGTIDRDWGDLPIRPDFLPLLQQITRFLTRVSDVDTRPLLVGHSAPIPVDDPRVRRVEVKTPDGQRHAVERPHDEQIAWTFDQTRTAGHYAVTPDPPLPGLVALPGFSAAVDPAGADLRGPVAANVPGEHGPAAVVPARKRTELWHAALAGLFLLLAAEAALLFRRRRSIAV